MRATVVPALVLPHCITAAAGSSARRRVRARGSAAVHIARWLQPIHADERDFTLP
jgi:hypothetical protein